MAAFRESTGATGQNRHLLLDYVQRLDSVKRGRRAVHLSLSSLRPSSRREHHVRAAAASFDDLVGNLEGQCFILENSDIIVVYKEQAQSAVETDVQKVRFFFGDDPVIANDRSGDRFAMWFDVERQFPDFLSRVRDLVHLKSDPLPRKRHSPPDAVNKIELGEGRNRSLTPELLSRLELALEGADLSNLVRRQAVCSLTLDSRPEIQFEEFYFSIPDLGETMVPGVDLMSDRSLFHHLTKSLDRRMLQLLATGHKISKSTDISMNLNTSTILSDKFECFDRMIDGSTKNHIVIELQQMDVLGDLENYLIARNVVQERGYQIGLDGLRNSNIFLTDPRKLGVDIVKIIWGAEMFDMDVRALQRIRDTVNAHDQCRVVLTRVESPRALEFGRAMGISLFQGRYVDQLHREERRRRFLRELK
jgi:EAL domain-containing protein (putative c-di-GMP-specific phosphodiesterase class I)